MFQPFCYKNNHECCLYKEARIFDDYIVVRHILLNCD
jgi:hypothetical protein